MFRHHQIWAAIDRLADEHDLSPSGLARRAGLDPTTFNKSKRFSKDGRERWPSTESISKILAATQTSMNAFGTFLAKGSSSKPEKPFPLPQNTVPVLGMAQAGSGGFFDDGGFPSGEGWEEAVLPVADANADYALRITGDSMLPVYRKGDIVVVSKDKQPTTGDRVIVKTSDGEVMAKVLAAEDDASMTFMSFNADHPNRVIPRQAIEWVSRITWVSQ